jgi:fucose 4-O-acetylase-like acetyltransferase
MQRRMRGEATTGGRRHDLDWLRIGATYLLFPFHVAKTFDVLPIYHIKNAELSPRLDLFTAFVHQWHMPLFFLLAGWSACASLGSRGMAGFRKERVRRLFVPFLFGSLVLCPFLKYVELSSGLSITATGAAPLGRTYDESFLRFLPTFYTRVDRFTWSHLWFLLYLFTFSVLYQRLFARLLARPGGSARASAARLYLPLLPLVLIQTTLRFVWPGVQNLFDDWANFTYYSLFFILGFLLARFPEWEAVIAREWRRAGAIGVGAAAVMLFGWWLRSPVKFPVPLTVADVLPAVPLHALSAVAGYCIVVGLLGFARRHLGTTGPLQDYLVESSLPVYVLHQLGIVVPGYFIIRLDAGIPAKFALLLAVAVTSTMAVYHLLVRPTPALRAVLGMRPRPVLAAATIGARAP